MSSGGKQEKKLGDQFLILQSLLDEKTKSIYYELTNMRYEITKINSKFTDTPTIFKHMMAQNQHS